MGLGVWERTVNDFIPETPRLLFLDLTFGTPSPNTRTINHVRRPGHSILIPLAKPRLVQGLGRVHFLQSAGEPGSRSLEGPLKVSQT